MRRAQAGALRQRGGGERCGEERPLRCAGQAWTGTRRAGRRGAMGRGRRGNTQRSAHTHRRHARTEEAQRALISLVSGVAQQHTTRTCDTSSQDIN